MHESRPPNPLSRADSVRIRRAFWNGPIGLLIVAVAVLLVLALLVGWVLIWVEDPDGPSITWLTLGPIAFSIVFALLIALFFSLRRSNRLRATEIAFLTGASHNLRTPLTAIRTGLQTLHTLAGTDHLTQADREVLWTAIQNETSRLELRIESLIEAARLDLEHRPYDRRPIDLVGLVRDVLDELRWAFAAQGGTVEPPDADAPLMVDGDERGLRLLFENLVDNALKYADGPARVVVTCTQSADHAVVRIRDHGLGFGPVEAAALFDGRRGDTGRRGSGLGLRLARAIARGHGGELRLDSEGPKLGATAEVWLPLEEEV
ncbi:MAG: HAMP domain-containing histidine kinase [Deltaproteobacteria bacterium]|nr:HAMP domain-containing histidine kinase [Deltaproteobacteria bacterium]